jgi:hypothetical protein
MSVRFVTGASSHGFGARIVRAELDRWREVSLPTDHDDV